MAYTRKNEKIINILFGLVIGTIVTAGIIIFTLYNNKQLVATINEPTLELKTERQEIIEEEQSVLNIETVGISDEARIQDYEMIKLPSNLKLGDYVDIRIKSVEGEDKVVLSKKEVRELDGGTIWFEINEIERVNMNKATVEATNQKSIIYATVYVNPDIQKPAEVDY